MPTTLLSLNLAPTHPPPPNAAARGWARQPVAGRWPVSTDGLDEAVPPSPAASGLRSRALCAYPCEHYPFWNTVRAQMGAASWEDRLPWGALGEHLTLSGWLESEAWVGDLLRFPDCTLAVSEPRDPTADLGTALGFPQAVQAMAAHAWSGFYLAVRVPGTLAAGEAFEVIPGRREIGVAELFRARRRA